MRVTEKMWIMKCTDTDMISPVYLYEWNAVVHSKWGRLWNRSTKNKLLRWSVVYVMYELLTLVRTAMQYDSVYLTCSKKLTDSQLSLPHGTNKKCKIKTKNKLMSMISPVQSSPVPLSWRQLPFKRRESETDALEARHSCVLCACTV